MSVQRHLEEIAPQFRKEILNGGTFTKMVIAFAMRSVVYVEGFGGSNSIGLLRKKFKNRNYNPIYIKLCLSALRFFAKKGLYMRFYRQRR